MQAGKISQVLRQIANYQAGITPSPKEFKKGKGQKVGHFQYIININLFLLVAVCFCLIFFLMNALTTELHLAPP